MSKQKIKVTIPKQRFELLELNADGMPAICLVNAALLEFTACSVFQWQCSVVVQVSERDEQDLPTKSERKILDQFFHKMDEQLKQRNNALFLSRVTWNKTQQWLWQVHNPQQANDFLLQVIESQSHPRPFSFSINSDEDWAKTQWLLSPLKK